MAATVETKKKVWTEAELQALPEDVKMDRIAHRLPSSYEQSK